MTRKYYIDGTGYELEETSMKASELLFWDSNPRIYEKIRRKTGSSQITQSEIQKFFLEEVDSVNTLKTSIAKAGGINVPLFVQKAQDSSDYVVYEGNTRLAAVRQMHFKGLSPYNDSDLIPVQILPQTMNEDLINTVVGNEQLNNTKKDWDAFELVAYVAREYEGRANQGHSEKSIYAGMKNEFSISSGKVKSSVRIINFMKENGLDKQMKGVNRFSHWNFYHTNKEHQKISKLFNDKEKFNEIKSSTASKPFDKIIIDIVMDDNAPKAVDFRDQLVKISKEYERDESHIEHLIAGTYKISDIASMISDDNQVMYSFLDTTYEKLVSRSFKDDLLAEKLKTDKKLQKKVKTIVTKLKVHVDLAGAIETGVEDTDRFKKINLIEANAIADYFWDKNNLPKTIKKQHIKNYFKMNKGSTTKSQKDELMKLDKLPEEIMRSLL